MAEAVAIVYIDRRYDDEPDAPRPWPRLRRWNVSEPEWIAVFDGPGSGVEEASFESVEEAIAWARERSNYVLVRLGSYEDSMYSAGVVHLTTRVDGTGRPYLEWPPDRWPDYLGPDAETRNFWSA